MRRPAPTPPAEPKQHLPVAMGGGARRCGSCQECCTVLEVQDLSLLSDDGDGPVRTISMRKIDKPAYQRCSYLKSSGSTRCCSIADAAPRACREFSCMWLDGMGGRRDRPDEMGVVFVVESDGKGGLIHMLWESRPGATKGQRALEYARKLSENHKDRPVVAAGVFTEGEHEGDPWRRVLYYPEDRMGELALAVATQNTDAVDAPHP